MFATENQRVRACRAMLRTIELERLWGHGGPTDEAIRLRDQNHEGYSSGERVLCQLVWDMWNGTGNARIDDLMHRLDPTRFNVVTSFLAAFSGGDQAIEAWIAAQEVLF